MPDSSRAQVNGLLFTYDPGRDLFCLSAMAPGQVCPHPNGTFQAFLATVLISDVPLLQAAFCQARKDPAGLIHASFRMALSGEIHVPVSLSAQFVPGAGVHLITGAIVEQVPDSTELDRFIQATNTSPDTIFLLDFDTNQHFWSHAFQKKYGYTPFTGADVVEQWSNLVHPDDRARVMQSHSAARSGGTDEWQAEYRFRRADGTYAVVIDRASFVRRHDGTIARSISSLEDVTELRDREAELQLATEVLQEVQYSWDVAANRLSFGANLLAQFGFSPGPFAQDANLRFEMIHPEDRVRVRTQQEVAITSANVYLEQRYRIVHPTGRVLHVVDRSRLARDTSGRLLRVVGSLVDEARLQREERRLRAVVEVAANVIYELDPATGIIDYSEGMQATFGHTLLGKMQAGTIWSDLVHDDDRDQVVAEFKSFLNGTDRFGQLKYRFKRADGKWANVRERMIALRDDDGVAVRLFGGMEDVTTEMVNEERLRQSDKLEAIGKLTGGVAHDFNNLLTVIIGNSELLEIDPDLSPDQKVIASNVSAAARRGAELISSLMAFARRQPLAPKPLDTKAIIVELDGLLKRTLPANVTLQTIIPKDLWIVEADPAQLNAALLNLAINASDAMPNGGRIVLECSNVTLDEASVSHMPEVATGDYLRIDLTDNGSGMPPDVVATAFDPFFTTKPLGQGSGLGLSMVWGFARQSGGHAKIYSENQHGTKVTLYLPRSSLKTALEPVLEQSREVPKGNQQHILVVEDEPMLRRFVVAMLDRLNYKTSQADNGEQALEILRTTPGICMLFSDIVMPGNLNGKELAEKALEEFPGLIVLFTSGYTENSIVHHGRLDAGVNFLAKPYQLRDLAQKLAKLIGGPTTHRQAFNKA